MADAPDREELQRALDVARAERDAFLRQFSVALGERNEFVRQRDVLLLERDRLLAEHPRPVPAFARDRADQPSVFVTTLPKSGTEFTSAAIADASGLARPVADAVANAADLSGYSNLPEPISTGVFTSERLNLAGLHKLQPNGVVWMSHCAATWHNICTLREAGFARISVLVRDPRDATVSWTYHLRAVPEMRHYNSFIQHLPRDYDDWTHQAQLGFQVRTFLPAAVNWIEGWVDAAAAGDLAVHIITFDALRTDAAGTIAALLAFHGVTEVDLTRIRPPKAGERHFRAGQSGTWASEFSATDRAFSAALIGDRLKPLFDEFDARACRAE